uniref:Uncharacterized protein n=1 Tax=Physcomitrium patens TaxID=3218 RepID=A9TX05_PHYPA|nr:hypothetical protein PHYPA_025916 [Physcomitrium patens]
MPRAGHGIAAPALPSHIIIPCEVWRLLVTSRGDFLSLTHADAHELSTKYCSRDENVAIGWQAWDVVRAWITSVGQRKLMRSSLGRFGKLGPTGFRQGMPRVGGEWDEVEYCALKFGSWGILLVDLAGSDALFHGYAA